MNDVQNPIPNFTGWRDIGSHVWDLMTVEEAEMLKTETLKYGNEGRWTEQSVHTIRSILIEQTSVKANRRTDLFDPPI